jgi:hypothetical protein
LGFSPAGTKQNGLHPRQRFRVTQVRVEQPAFQLRALLGRQPVPSRVVAHLYAHTIFIHAATLSRRQPEGNGRK